MNFANVTLSGDHHLYRYPRARRAAKAICDIACHFTEVVLGRKVTV